MGPMVENPVLTKEMRSRMRGARGPVIQLAYVALIIALSAIMYGIFKVERMGGGGGPYNTRQAAEFGHMLFIGISVLQASMVCLLAPAFTSAAITGEREQRSLDMLLVTKLRPRSILLGKLGSALSYIGLLIVSSIPVLSVCFLFGGVSPAELICTYVLIATTGVFFGLTGLFWSCVFHRTMQATAAAYATVALLCIVVTVLDIVLDEFVWNTNAPVLSCINPLMGLASIFEEPAGGSFSLLGVPFWVVTIVSQVLAMPVLLLISVALLRRRQ
jgi:ABC-type transport system involved in multi-copper enzyme maturation permease subunit